LAKMGFGNPYEKQADASPQNAPPPQQEQMPPQTVQPQEVNQSYLNQPEPVYYIEENPQITYGANGQPISINGRELTPFERIDLMDGVLDGKYFGAPIVGVEDNVASSPNTTVIAASGPPPASVFSTLTYNPVPAPTPIQSYSFPLLPAAPLPAATTPLLPTASSPLPVTSVVGFPVSQQPMYIPQNQPTITHSTRRSLRITAPAKPPVRSSVQRVSQPSVQHYGQNWPVSSWF
jgi:hypothetical protein